MNTTINIDFHTTEEMPFVDVPVYGRMLEGDKEYEEDSILIFWTTKGRDQNRAIFSGIVTVEINHDDYFGPSCKYHIEELPAVKSKMFKEKNISILGWCELPISEANRILQEVS